MICCSTGARRERCGAEGRKVMGKRTGKLGAEGAEGAVVAASV